MQLAFFVLCVGGNDRSAFLRFCCVRFDAPPRDIVYNRFFFFLCFGRSGFLYQSHCFVFCLLCCSKLQRTKEQAPKHPSVFSKSETDGGRSISDLVYSRVTRSRAKILGRGFWGGQDRNGSKEEAVCSHRALRSNAAATVAQSESKVHVGTVFVCDQKIFLH